MHITRTFIKDGKGGTKSYQSERMAFADALNDTRAITLKIRNSDAEILFDHMRDDLDKVAASYGLRTESYE